MDSFGKGRGDKMRQTGKKGEATEDQMEEKRKGTKGKMSRLGR